MIVQEITSTTAAGYLQVSGRIIPGEPVSICELAGGVSNVVLLVELPDRGQRFVLKQARAKLRVKEDWQCSIERIWREVETLRICGSLLQVSSPQTDGWVAAVPQILWEDRDNYAYAMTAAPPEHKTWKEILLAGELEASQQIATCCGRLLGRLHAASWNCHHIAKRLDDRAFFDQLRLDPYYFQIGRVHPNLADCTQQLVESVSHHRQCLVHGDFSPKNLLVWPGQVLLIDFEVGHYGDPAFDLGFFLTHLVLKSIWSGPRRAEYLQLVTRFWEAYRPVLARAASEIEICQLEARACWNLAGCMLARVDGKSPVDYLTSQHQEEVRTRAIDWMRRPPADLRGAVVMLL
jgi:5-methylthioribose kinase